MPTILGLTLCAAAVWSCVSFVRGRSHAGSILFRTPTPLGGIAADVATATLALLGAVWLFLADISSPSRPAIYGLVIISLALAVRTVVQPHGRIQVHEHGVYVRKNLSTTCTFIPWNRLGSYRFCPDNSLVLQYRAWRTSDGFPSDVTVPYPYHQRDELDALFAPHRPQRYPQTPVSA